LSYTYIVVSHSFRFLESYNNTKSGTAIRHGEKLQTELRETIRHGEQPQTELQEGIRHGEQPLQKLERQFAVANSHYKNWNSNSPWRTAITKNETPLRARRMFAPRGA